MRFGILSPLGATDAPLMQLKDEKVIYIQYPSFEQHETINLFKEDDGKLNTSSSINSLISQPQEVVQKQKGTKRCGKWCQALHLFFSKIWL